MADRGAATAKNSFYRRWLLLVDLTDAGFFANFMGVCFHCVGGLLFRGWLWAQSNTK